MGPFLRKIGRFIFGGPADETDTADLHLRADRHGGPLLPEVLPSRKARTPRKRYVILIHGFNVNLPGALKSYDCLLDNLQPTARLKNDIPTLAWPGDPRLPRIGNGLPADYAKAVNVAVSAASKLADYLHEIARDRNPPPEIVLIAHSLGSRLVLETIEAWRARTVKLPARIYVVLMAAAVPSRFAESGRLRRALLEAHERVVVYSRNDSVLRYYFPRGQMISDDSSPSDVEAIGLYGRPSTAWTRLTPNHHLDHGDYWQSGTVARIIADCIRFRQPTDLPGDDLPARMIGGCGIPGEVEE